MGETGHRSPPPPLETPLTETHETPVAQQKQVETGRRETVIITAPSEDVSNWSKYAVTYYKRSKTSASETARNRNRNRYEEYKDLLETAGKTVTELKDTLQIT